MTKKLTAVSLFSGCGGFDWGASQAGVEIIWANDVYSHAADAYKAIFKDVEFMEGDVRDIKTFPSADVIIGCYPCTGFSVAARRRWKNQDNRNLFEINGNFLYLEFLRALDQVKPKHFFVENVRGMVSAEKGWFFDQQIKGFEEKGYTVKHKLLSAVDFGAAQSRQRIFIVGVRNDITSEFDYKFPEPTFGPDFAQNYVTMKDVIGEMPLWPEGEYLDRKYHGHYLTRNRKRGWDSPSYTIVAQASHVPLHPMGEPMTKIGKDKWKLQGDNNRRLSWRECAALQGLPSDIAPSGTLEHKYRVVGNAVPPVFGKALLTPVVKFESQ